MDAGTDIASSGLHGVTMMDDGGVGASTTHVRQTHVMDNHGTNPHKRVLLGN
jgi:hypothetical protein